VSCERPSIAKRAAVKRNAVKALIGVRPVTQATALTPSKHLYAVALATVLRMVSMRCLRRRVVLTASLFAGALLPGCGLLAPPPEPPAPPPLVVAAPPPSPPKPTPPAPPQEAKPRVERLHSGPPNHEYDVRGQHYVPEKTDVPVYETGLASWYGAPFHGKRTATGERYDMNAMTAAHKTMPLPSYALVRNPANGRQVVVKVNDRGPFVKGRIIDLSRAAARRLGISGVAQVEVRRITHDEILSGAWKLPVQRVANATPP
jgi:rare lipoprotein A